MANPQLLSYMGIYQKQKGGLANIVQCPCISMEFLATESDWFTCHISGKVPGPGSFGSLGPRDHWL